MKFWTTYIEDLREYVLVILELLEFYVWGRDWEFNEKEYYEVVEELTLLLFESDYDNREQFLIDYIKKNYPFNIK